MQSLAELNEQFYNEKWLKKGNNKIEVLNLNSFSDTIAKYTKTGKKTTLLGKFPEKADKC